MGNLTPGNGTASPYLSGSQVYALAVNAGFSQTPQYTINGQKYSQAEIMTAISHAESNGWDANAQGDLNLAPYGSNGLWQIYSKVHPPSEFGLTGAWSPANVQLIDVPQTNADAAFEIWKSQGFNAWSTYTSGAYKDWLPQASVAAEGPNGNIILTSAQQGGAPVSASTAASTASSTTGSGFLSGAGSLLLSPFQSLFTDLGQGLERIAYGLIGLVLVFMALHQAGK
jgi:hypothetical protein